MRGKADIHPAPSAQTTRRDMLRHYPALPRTADLCLVKADFQKPQTGLRAGGSQSSGCMLELICPHTACRKSEKGGGGDRARQGRQDVQKKKKGGQKTSLGKARQAGNPEDRAEAGLCLQPHRAPSLSSSPCRAHIHRGRQPLPHQYPHPFDLWVYRHLIWGKESLAALN